jgi:hypothetical protein
MQASPHSAVRFRQHPVDGFEARAAPQLTTPDISDAETESTI